jgi:hypothetical protein
LQELEQEEKMKMQSPEDNTIVFATSSGDAKRHFFLKPM